MIAREERDAFADEIRQFRMGQTTIGELLRETPLWDQLRGKEKMAVRPPTNDKIIDRIESQLSFDLDMAPAKQCYEPAYSPEYGEFLERCEAMLRSDLDYGDVDKLTGWPRLLRDALLLVVCLPIVPLFFVTFMTFYVLMLTLFPFFWLLKKIGLWPAEKEDIYPFRKKEECDEALRLLREGNGGDHVASTE